MMKEGDNNKKNMVALWSLMQEEFVVDQYSKGKRRYECSLLTLKKQFVIVFSHILAFAKLVGKAWKTKHTQQWIHLLMENLMVKVASWSRTTFESYDHLFKHL